MDGSVCACMRSRASLYCLEAKLMLTGAALITLAASAPGTSFLNNGLPTIVVGFTVRYCLFLFTAASAAEH